jgi:hypothetical protein
VLAIRFLPVSIFLRLTASLGDPDLQVLGLPDPLVRGKDPDPDPGVEKSEIMLAK